MSFDKIVEALIKEAQERGEFDNLPGMGKPLPGRGEPDDEMWWVKQYIRREGLSTDALLPTSLQLAKEIERLPETVRGLPSEYAVRELVGNLNRRIVDYLRAPSGPHVPVGRIDADVAVERWREARRTPVAERDSAEPVAEASPVRSSRERSRWRGWFGRRRSDTTTNATINWRG